MAVPPGDTSIRPPLVARIDPDLTATLDRLTPILYAEGGSPADDVPPHARAASALRRSGSRLVIVQDDVNVLALRDEAGSTSPQLLPLGPGGRRVFDDGVGNKASKMDLEACAALPDGRLVVFGSGSSPAREALVVLAPDHTPRVVPAGALYRALRQVAAFAGPELNVEGALVHGGELLLLQRGNGAPRGEQQAVNAIGAIDLEEFVRWLDAAAEGAAPAAPRLAHVTPVALGHTGGVPFGLTDAALAGGGRIVLLACAEDSPDAVRDGPVLGCRVGLLEGAELRVTDVLDEHARPSLLKLEGIERRPATSTEYDVVADMDRPAEPARLGRLRLDTR